MDEGLAKRLYEGVRKAYSLAAERPAEQHPFPVGRAFAESLGYPKELLDTLLTYSVDAFAGVSNVSMAYAAISLPRRKPGKDEAQHSIRPFYEAVKCESDRTVQKGER